MSKRKGEQKISSASKKSSFSFWSKILLMIGLGWFAYLLFQSTHHPNFSDTLVYRTAGLKAWSHLTAYDVEGHYTFNYPPFASFFYGLVLGQISFPEVAWIFYFFTFASWIFLLWRSHWGLFGSALFLLAYGEALRDETKLGQTMILPLLSFFPALYFEKEEGWKKTFLFPFFLALSFNLKIYWMLCFPVLLFQKRFRDLALILASHFFILNGLILILFHGWTFALEENLKWIQALQTAGNHLMKDFYNVSVAGFFAKQTGDTNSGKLATLLFLAPFLTVLFYFRKISFNRLSRFSLFAVPFLNPVAWPYWILLGSFFMIPEWIVAIQKKQSSVFILFLLFLLSTFSQNTPLVDQGYLTWGIFLGMLAAGKSFQLNPEDPVAGYK